ncbi:MAG: DUF2283 domain-containing protein [Theionarchaea archaeon]|nr:DUF2283 domain-containing protein [Theionarchaea archaeon]
MKITYDPKTDAVYIQFQEGEYSISKEISEGIILDYTEEGKVMGIEILEVSQKMPLKNIEEITLSIPVKEVLQNKDCLLQ